MTNHSTRRISKIANDLFVRSYLEIGVKWGATFNNLDILEKDAVDPKFLFDTKQFETENIRFFQMTSDNFFINFHKNKKYDLAFIDGLHTFEQTFRDFCSFTSAAHDDSVCLIDDVYPSDIYSAHPDQKKAYHFRNVSNIKSMDWHGDVYKIVFAIHDFFPNISYRTIKTNENPQLVLWKRPRRNFSPLFNNLEKITRLDYYEIFDHLDVFNFGDEDEVLNDVIRSIKN
jgi:hypothetical protein